MALSKLQPFSTSINTGNQNTIAFIESSDDKVFVSAQELRQFSETIDLLVCETDEECFIAEAEVVVAGTKGLDRIMQKIYKGTPLTVLEKARFKPKWEQIKQITGKLGIAPKPFVAAMKSTGEREFKEAFGHVAILLARVGQKAKLELEEIRFLQTLWPKEYGPLGTPFKPLMEITMPPKKGMPPKKALAPLKKTEAALIILAKKAGKVWEKQALKRLAKTVLSALPFVGPAFWAWDIADIVKSKAFKDSFKKLMKSPEGKRALLKASENKQVFHKSNHPRIPAGSNYHCSVGWY